MTAGTNPVARGRRATVAAKKKAAFDRFVLPDHKAGSAAAPTSLGSLEAALGFSSASPHTTAAKDGLQDLVDDLVKADPEVAKTAFAVIDLTQPTPRYAGHRATLPFYPASMGKLMLMLGAYQLRFDLHCLAVKEKITDAEDLFERAAEVFADLQVIPKGAAKTTLRAKGPKIELEDGRRVLLDGKPVWMGDWGKTNLEKIFDKKGPTTPPAFKDDGLGFHQLYYIEYVKARKDFHKDAKAMGLKTTDESQLGFLDRLKMMIGFSSNYSPRYIGGDLGLALCNSPLWRGELFHPTHGGLWLGTPYMKDGWRSAPGGGGRTTASALALATLFAALFRDKVTDAASCAEMRVLLQKGYPPADLYTNPTGAAGVAPGVGTRSFIGDALRYHGRTSTVHSKLGIYNGTSDTAHVQRAHGAKTLRYTLAILDVAKDHHDRLYAVTKGVDDAVLAVNP